MIGTISTYYQYLCGTILAGHDGTYVVGPCWTVGSPLQDSPRQPPTDPGTCLEGQHLGG